MSAGSSDQAAIELLPTEPVVRNDLALESALVQSAGAAQRWRSSLRSVAIGGASIACWLLAWELASRYELDLFFRFENIPAPSEVVLALSELLQTPKFAAHVGNSVLRIFLGFSIAAVLAVISGLLIGRFRLAAQ